MDLYDTDLTKWLNKHPHAPNTKEDIIRQLTTALVYIHDKKGYCHLDLSPSNILIKLEGGVNAAISDFGLSQLYKKSAILQTSETRPGKAPYNMAPDTHLTDKYDMWSFGLIVYKILSTGRITESEVINLNTKAREDHSLLVDFVLHNLRDPSMLRLRLIVLECLKATEERISASQLLDNYFNSDDVTNSISSSSSDDTVISFISVSSRKSSESQISTSSHVSTGSHMSTGSHLSSVSTVSAKNHLSGRSNTPTGSQISAGCHIPDSSHLFAGNYSSASSHQSPVSNRLSRGEYRRRRKPGITESGDDDSMMSEPNASRQELMRYQLETARLQFAANSSFRDGYQGSRSDHPPELHPVLIAAFCLACLVCLVSYIITGFLRYLFN